MKTKRNTTIFNIGYLFILQALNFIIPLLLLPYLLKTLGPEKFGIISLAQAIAAYFTLLVDFGFNLSAVQRIAVNRNNVDEMFRIFWGTMYAKASICVICFFLNVILIYTVKEFYAIKEVIYIFFSTVIGLAIVPIWFFQGVERVKLVTIINVTIRILILPLTFIFVKKPGDYYISAIIQSACIVISGIISFCFVFRYYPIKLYRFNIKSILIEVKESWPVFVSNVAINIYSSSFVIILSFYSSKTAIAYYSTSDKIARALASLILLPVTQAVYPKISYLVTINRAKAIHLFKKTAIVASLILLGGCIMLFFFSSIIINFLGASYYNMLPLLKLMSIAPLLICMGGIFGQAGLLAFGDKKGFRDIILLCGSVSLVVVLILTMLFKEYGTAISMIITEFLVLLLMYRRCLKYILRPVGSSLTGNL